MRGAGARSRRQALQALRAWATVGAGLGTGVLLGGCGFALRSATALPMQRLHLAGPAVERGTSLGQEWRRQLASRVELTDTEAAAQAVLRVETAAREKVVGGFTASGLVRELVLRLRFRFRLTTPGGRVLIDSTELLLVRDLSTTEGAALAKAREEDEIFRVLERDMVMQTIRRLEALPASRLQEKG